MFCHNCGANLPEGTVFCGNCGARQNAQQRAASQQQAPVQQRQQPTPVQQRTAPQPPVYQPQPANRPPLPVSKKEFLSQHADPSTRQNVKLATATFILTLVLILASIVIPLATPFHKIPAVSLLFSIVEADPDELIEEIEDTLDDAKDSLKEEKAYMSDDELESAEAVVDSMETLSNSFSVLNFKNFVSVVQKEGSDYLDNEDLDIIALNGMIMDIIIGALIGAFFLPLLFALLAGINKSAALTVTALIFTVLSQLTLCGIVFVLLSLVVFIFQAVLCSKIKRAYDAYRYSRA